jgi:hypothetical protein
MQEVNLHQKDFKTILFNIFSKVFRYVIELAEYSDVKLDVLSNNVSG